MTLCPDDHTMWPAILMCRTTPRSNLGKAAAASKLEPPSDITGADSEEPLEEGTDKSLQLPSRGRERSDNKVGALNAPDVLTCGVKAETTIFDHLSGVKYRDHLPQVSSPF